MKFKGKVKWFNPDKGYGFIAQKNSRTDIFLHISALKKAGLDDLPDNQDVEYEIVEEQGKKCATNISLV